MTANKVIIVSVSLYLVLMALCSVWYSNQSFTKSDAAGNGMASGLTFFYGLGILFIVAIVLTIFNAFFFREVTQTWIKFLFFLPLLLPLLIFSYQFFEIGRPSAADFEDRFRKLTIEIRASEKIDGGTLRFKSSNSSSSSKLRYLRTENDSFIYEKSTAISFGHYRWIQLLYEDFESKIYELEIPEEPELTPFTTWAFLYDINIEDQDTVSVEFRYKIED
ncbi:MAG: hypothetical protein AAF502_20265 [Bacteroidota bacterium]